MNLQYLRLHSPHHLENTNISRFLVDLHKYQQYFQELVTGILKDFNFTIAYLDDIMIFNRTAEEHLDHIKEVFEKLRSAHLSVKLSKCHFLTKEIQYIGHILSTKGIRPLPSKTQAIQNMYPPKTPKQVCTFLGLVGYHRKLSGILKK